MQFRLAPRPHKTPSDFSTLAHNKTIPKERNVSLLGLCLHEALFYLCVERIVMWWSWTLTACFGTAHFFLGEGEDTRGVKIHSCQDMIHNTGVTISAGFSENFEQNLNDENWWLKRRQSFNIYLKLINNCMYLYKCSHKFWLNKQTDLNTWKWLTEP